MVLPSSGPAYVPAAQQLRSGSLQRSRVPLQTPVVNGGHGPHGVLYPMGDPRQGGPHGQIDPGFSPGSGFHGRIDTGFGQSDLGQQMRSLIGGGGGHQAHGTDYKYGSPQWVKQQMGAMNAGQRDAFTRWTQAAAKPQPLPTKLPRKPPVGANPMAGMDPAQRAAFQAWTSAVGPQGHAAPGPSAAELLNWGNQRDALNSSYLQGLAQNDFARSNLMDNFGLQDYQLNHANEMARAHIPYGDMRRGMLTSGVYGQHLQDQATNYDLALRQLLSQHDAGLNQLSLSRQNLERTRANGLAGVDQAEAYRRMQLAQMLGGQ